MLLRKIKYWVFAISSCWCLASCAQYVHRADVLVVGGGTAGIAAGIQAARMGVSTLIAEETTWVGGMLSSAGVSAIDGNHMLPSGIWKEFRQRIYDYYGGPGRVATGWVSNTHFEPHVADSILKSMAAAEKKLAIRYQLQFVDVINEGQQIKGALFVDLTSGDTISIQASQVIDATELGDVFANAGISYDVGMEASALTGENVNVPNSSDIIQDLTYVAILKDYGKGVDCTIVKPAGYDPSEFDGACLDFYKDSTRIKPGVDCAKMLTYAKLPGKKYMLNWPAYGNDIYLHLINLSPQQRKLELEKAKQQTLRYIYFIQQELGYKHFGLANDEFPTDDRLALMPYHREGRRMQGLVRFKIQHISDPFNEQHPLYRTGIAVGDYPIDHHHRKNPEAPQHLGFYPIPSFNVPLGALIPASHKGIIVAEKGISVSNVVNGTTRLQPCVLLIGQAAGTLAALTVQNEYAYAGQVSVRKVQEALLNAGAYLMPYADVNTTNPFFASIQRIGATGFLKGAGQPNAWANRTWFYPDSTLSMQVFLKGVPTSFKVSAKHSEELGSQELTLTSLLNWIQLYKKLTIVKLPLSGTAKKSSNEVQVSTERWKEWGLSNYDTSRPLLRKEVAVLLDKLIDPFNQYIIKHNGEFNLL
ncbi:MAG: FAD-dependent oxidoreductase [Chitinophagaceae bacterium]